MSIKPFRIKKGEIPYQPAYSKQGGDDLGYRGLIWRVKRKQGNRMPLATKLNYTLETRPSLDFFNVCGEVFGQRVSQAMASHHFHRVNLAPHPEGYDHFSCWLQSDNNAGYAVSRLPITNAGHRELINVFSTVSGVKNGERLMDHAISTYGQLSLDCYDGVLVDFYSSCGFYEFDRVANWTAGQPDIVFMRYERT